MSSFSGLYIGMTGLQAQQLRQEVISHNITNSDTTGYTRQEVITSAIPAADVLSPIPTSGLGVSVDGLRRSVSTLLNQQIQSETSTSSYWKTVASGMETLEANFQEPSDSGLSEQLNQFWTDWRDLASDPTASSARLAVQSDGETLASSIKQLYNTVQSFASELDGEVGTQVDEFNTLASQVAALNTKIAQAPASNPALDLQDQRDLLLEKLAGYAAITSHENDDGTISVSLGGHLLVNGDKASKLGLTQDAEGNSLPIWADDKSIASISGGDLGANIQLRDWAKGEVSDSLNSLANNLITQVNAIHSTGYDLDGNTGHDFFTGTGAATIQLASEVAQDYNAIAAAAGTTTGGTTTAGEAGDGSIALKIAGLQEGNTDSPHDSISGLYSEMVAQMGNDVETARTTSDTQESLLELLKSQRNDVAGVSLNEEAVQMLSSQRAFEAASRVVTAMDDMLDRLINSTGMVGR